MYSVTVRSLSKSFGATPVLNDVSLNIAAGEFFFLLGPSGCGKTTLLRMLAGFEQPDAGAILFDDQDVSRLPPQKRNASMVFQNYALWPHMTVRQNVAYGLESRHVAPPERETRVNDVLDMVRMKDFADRLPGQLSGGQQQRIALARALVVRPQLLLLDEPLSNLDARLRAEMRYELARVHRETGVTAIYVTHDQQEALSLADRIAYMDDHRIIQVGTPRELYLRPRSLAAARFLGDANVIAGTCRSVEHGRVTVETSFGPLTGIWMGDASPSVGASAHAVVRPEKLSVVSEPRTNVVKGTVARVFYEGVSERLLLSVNGMDIHVELPAREQPSVVGSEVTVGAIADDVLVFA